MHPLEQVIRESEGFILIGDSSQKRFPAMSYHAYVTVGKPFYCLDLGGLTESRGKTEGGKVYTTVDEIPDDHDDLAIIWVHPKRSTEAVEIAHEAGCTRVWFSFQTGHRDAVARARELGMEVIEIGRCPVYYLEDMPIECKAHTAITKLSGSYKRPPQTDPDTKRRELW